MDKVIKVPLSEIIIKERIREDSGDLSLLMDSLMKRGLLNPIIITKEKQLLAGFRRIEAARNLGWKEIDCRVISAATSLDKLMIETEENTTRKDFTPDEFEKMIRLKVYYSSRGLMKFFLWLEKIWKQIVYFFKKLRKKRAG